MFISKFKNKEKENKIKKLKDEKENEIKKLKCKMKKLKFQLAN